MTALEWLLRRICGVRRPSRPPARQAAASHSEPRFVDVFVDRRHRFSLGTDTRSGGLFLGTPVSGRRHAVEFEAYFVITPDEYVRYREDPRAAEPFLELCRAGGAADRRIDDTTREAGSQP